MDLVDTTTDMGKGMLNMYKELGNIHIGGYIQPQFQLAQSKGAPSYAGGDFPDEVNNRFMLRRGRIRFDYFYHAPKNGPSLQFVFQFDGTERGVFIRDFWGRIFENKYQLFSLTTGMFARPFGYELNLSSSDRESPERGRMSQILMKTERDLGAMLSFEVREKQHPLKHLKIDMGFFNGQGLAAANDFDSKKDFIARIVLKPYKIGKKLQIGGSVSMLNGGMLQNTRYVHTLNKINNQWTFTLDSALSNAGKIAPRKYYGADLQAKIKRSYGYTELRAEYIAGKQTATLNSTETPTKLFSGDEAHYIRSFNGAYFYFLQHIVNNKNQLGVKFDWYDPNTKVAGKAIGQPGATFTVADIRYATLGFGYIYQLNEHIKFTFWYDKVWNEPTQIQGFTTDAKDNIFTSRIQYRF
jgi:hypothetical protein